MFRDCQSYRTVLISNDEKSSIVRKNVKDPSVSADLYECNICGEKWMSEMELDIHRKTRHLAFIMATARNVQNNMCWLCYHCFEDSFTLLRHIKREHFHSSPEAERIEREIYFCDHCKCMFFDKNILSWHIFYYHLDKEVVLECSLCYRFSQAKNVWHHSNQHDFSSYTTCPFCYKSFKNNTEMLSHVTTHPYVLRCDTCMFDTKSRKLYEEHLKKHSLKASSVVENYDRYFIKYSMPKLVTERWLKGLNLPFCVSVCVLCRHICLDEESRKNHIFQDHGVDPPVKKVHLCACGDEFFNAVLLRQHILKMKGNHRALTSEEIENINLDVLYHFNDGIDDNMEEIDLVEEPKDPLIIVIETADN